MENRRNLKNSISHEMNRQKIIRFFKDKAQGFYAQDFFVLNKIPGAPPKDNNKIVNEALEIQHNVKFSNLQISGDLHNDPKTLEKFSKDASFYRVMSTLVAEPKSKDDILKILQFAKKEGLSITSRVGGSGLSSARVREDIILNF